MNLTAQLVNFWAEFEEKHKGAGIEEFCRHHLATADNEKIYKNLFAGEMPPRPDIVLSKLLDRFARLHMIYIQLAMEGLKIKHFEEFSLLSAISQLKTPRKTEVIYHTLNELTTGLNLLASMHDRGLIAEQDDPDDKRSKRLRLTPKGEKLLKSCYERFSKVPEILFMDIPTEDILLCIQLLKNIELKFSNLRKQHKGQSFDKIYGTLIKK
jgi:DNA-binding MarR family transcriptional regulator